MDIQRFAADGTFQVDRAKLEESKVAFEQLFNVITGLIKDIASIAMGVMNNEAFTTTITESVKEVLQGIDSTIGTKLGDSFNSLTVFLGEAIAAYQELDVDISRSFEGWIDTAKTAINSISEGIHSNVEKGSYTTSSYVSDTATNIKGISDATKTIIKDTANIIGNTGKFIKSATGYNIAEIAQGTISTVMNFVSNGLGILSGR